jgi:phytanoyl-CoA hydroxylase
MPAAQSQRIDDLSRTYDRDGYVILRSLWSPEEVAAIRAAFFDLAEGGAVPGLFEPTIARHDLVNQGGRQEPKGDDPLLRYPRVLQPHARPDLPVGALSRRCLLDPRVLQVVAALYGETAHAVQSMFYFKPPGARGQAFHQDNYYLCSGPRTCMAAWSAIDQVDPDNGGLFVVPGSHRLPIQVPDKADPGESFTDVLVSPPEGMPAVPVTLDAGDVLFFDGNLIHGSFPNRSRDRFRSSFICHYIPASSTTLSHWYTASLTADGRPVRIAPPVDDHRPRGD